MLRNIRSKIIHSKMFAQRSMSYLAVVNSAMILFLLLSRLENYDIDIKIRYWFFPLVIMGIIALVLFGYLEDRLGFFEEESKAATRRNPQIEEILKRLKNLEKKLK